MEDPLRTFNQTVTASMQPTDAAAAQQQLQQAAAAVAGSVVGGGTGSAPPAGGVAPAPAALPTGRGIQTAFHSNNAAATMNATAPSAAVPGLGESVQQQQTQQYQVQQQQQQQRQAAEPATKRSKMENSLATGGGISSRLGFTLQQPGQAQPQQQQAQVSLSTGIGGYPQQQQVSLPVGVGIRIGGNGGVATGPGGISMTHTQWGAASGGAGGVGLSHVQHGQTAGASYPMLGGQANMMGGMGIPGGPMSDQAVAERRQRNREHAKRSRVRKKFMLESLQQEVHGLQKENAVLRQIIQAKIPEHSQKIIDDCCQKSPLFDDDAKSPIHDVKIDNKDAPKELVKSDFSLISSLSTGQQNFVLSDPRLPDNPIVYASQGFYELTGYSREQVLGRNCRFLQGPGTDPKAVDVIRTAIANGTDATTCILNYKADGTPFWNQFFVAALRDQDNCIVNYVGVQCAIDPESGVNALEDRVNMVMPLKEKEDEQDDS